MFWVVPPSQCLVHSNNDLFKKKVTDRQTHWCMCVTNFLSFDSRLDILLNFMSKANLSGAFTTSGVGAMVKQLLLQAGELSNFLNVVY